MKIFLPFIFLTISIFANTIEKKEYLFIDDSNSFTVEQIITKDKEFKPLRKYNFGVQTNTFWLKLELYNNSNETIKQRVYNKRAGLDFIDVYVFKDNLLGQTFILGDMRDQKTRDNIFRFPYFDVELEANEKLEIYIKQKAYGTMEMEWKLSNMEYFNAYINYQTIIYFLVVGILIVATIASFMFYFFLKKRYYLIYALFTICSIVYQLAVAGYFYEFGIPVYLNTVFNYTIPLVALVLLGLFPMSFFNLQKDEYKYLFMFLKLLIASLALIAFLNLFYPFIDGVLYSLRYTNIANILTMFVLLLISLKAFRDKKQGSVFYLISNVVLFLSIAYFISGLLGFIANNECYYYSLALGSISQDLFLALALVQATYLIKKENEKNTQLLHEYSKLTFIGQTMLNISHQWKTPINSIFNNINHIQAAKQFNDPNLDKVIEKSLLNIKQTALFLKDTALGQLDFYKSKESVEKINIYQEIGFLIKLIENEFSKKSIDVILDFDKNLELTIDKTSFLNVLMILFENSYKVFELRNIKNPFIKVSMVQNQDSLEIIFQDNAQGAKDDIDKIFDKNYSMNDSTGLGLYLAKEIVKFKLAGTLSAENKNNGMCFKLILED